MARWVTLVLRVTSPEVVWGRSPEDARGRSPGAVAPTDVAAAWGAGDSGSAPHPATRSSAASPNTMVDRTVPPSGWLVCPIIKTMWRIRLSREVIAMILMASILTGCAAAEPEGRTPLVADTGAPVIVPGGPGDMGRTARPGESLGDSEARVTAADVKFAEGMIPHHRQALEMAALVSPRSSSVPLRRLAERITAAQRSEIAAMTSWLKSVGRPADGHDDHTVTLEQMNRLRAARGEAFDVLFLNLMIVHHEAATVMAGRQLKAGGDRTMLAMAKDVVSGQGIEIARMRELLKLRG